MEIPPSLMSNNFKINGDKIITANWSKQYRLDIVDSEDSTNIINTSWHDEQSVASLVKSDVEPEFDGKIKRTVNSWVSLGSNYATITEPTNPITNVVMNDPYKISID